MDRQAIARLAAEARENRERVSPITLAKLSAPILAATSLLLVAAGCRGPSPTETLQTYLRACKAGDEETFRNYSQETALVYNGENAAGLMRAIASAEVHGIDLASCVLHSNEVRSAGPVTISCTGPKGQFKGQIPIAVGPKRKLVFDPLDVWELLHSEGTFSRTASAQRYLDSLQSAGLDAIWSSGGKGYRQEDLRQVLARPGSRLRYVLYRDVMTSY